MSGKVLIIVPTQGDDTSSFRDVAIKLRKSVYPNATILSTTVSESGGDYSVKFASPHGRDFDWSTAHDVSRVITISHGFSGDGPNLAYHAGGYQPWGTGDDGEFRQASKDFWWSVGKAMKKNGKIILLGCFMGRGVYASTLAKVSHRKVIAATWLFGAANAPAVLKHINAIERGKPHAPLREFNP